MKYTLLLVIANIAVFVVQYFISGFTELFALTPTVALHGAYWQFVTYMFLHANATHIMLNMFALALFGMIVENQLGPRKYLFLYFAAGLGSAVLHVAITGVSSELLLGASGAVFGVLTAYGILFPKNWIFVFGGLPLPAILAVFVFAAVEFVFGVFSVEPGVANFGHLGGIITGGAIMLYWKFIKRYRGRPVKHYEFIWE